MTSEKSYQWDAERYARYSSSQYAWAMELIERFRLRGDETILDIGCGDGKVTAVLAHRVPSGAVVGIDSSAEMIDLAERRYGKTAASRLSFQRLDVRNLEEKDRFDVVFSNAALHWIKDPLPVLRRMRRAMKKGGRLLFQMGGRGNARNGAEVLDRLISGTWATYFHDFEFSYGFYDWNGPGNRDCQIRKPVISALKSLNRQAALLSKG